MDSNPAGMDVPEIRIRKSSETPSMGSAGDVPVMAPMASFETLTDVSDWEESEHGDDPGTDKQSDAEDVFNDSGQNNGLSGSTGTLTECGVEAGASDSGLDKPSSLDVLSDEGEGSVTSGTPGKPDRPPSPMLSPCGGPPRRPPSPSRGPRRPPSPSRGPRARSPSPCRPPPPKVAAAKTPDDTDDRELFEIDDDDNSFIERKYGKGLETKSIERPRSTTPINIATLDSYVDESKDEQQHGEEPGKITISLPGSKKKHAKKHAEREKKSDQDKAESWMSFNQEQNLFSKSPVHSSVGGSSQAYQAAPVFEAAPESLKASWTTFGDDEEEPQFQQPAKKAPPKRPPGPARPPPPKLSTRRSMDAIPATEKDPFTDPPTLNRRTSAPNAGMSGYDDETSLVGGGDATSPTEKTAPPRPGRPPMPSMPTKPKGLSVSPKKGIQKLLKSPKYGKKKGLANNDDKTKFISKEEEKEVDKSSEKWLEFEQMQQRIQATMSRTKDNLHKLGSSIDKTITSIASNSPWGIMRQNGGSVEDKEEFSESGGSMSGSESGRSDPRAGWVGFEDNFTVTPNIELGAKLNTLEATPIPSPRHCPVPPHTSRNTSRRSSTGAEEIADFLGISAPIASGDGGDNLPPPPTSASYDLLEGGGPGAMSETEDMIGVYSRNPTGTISGRSSTMSTPTPYDQDMQMLESGPATPTEDTGPTDSALGLVDEILGLSGDEAKRLNTQKEMMGVLEKIQQLAKPKDEDDFFGLGAEDDDPFGLSSKPTETKTTTVAFGADLFGTPTEESKPVPGEGDTRLGPPPGRDNAASPMSDDFDPRSDFNVGAKPVADEAGDVWGDRQPSSTNPFAVTSTAIARPKPHKVSSTNPFASAMAAPVAPSPKNPFTADVGSSGAADSNLFGDATPAVALDIFNVGSNPDDAASPADEKVDAVGSSFNPFATISDADAHAPAEHAVSAADDFDPFMTITGDDAFVDLPGQDRKDSTTSGNKTNPFNAEPEPASATFVADFGATDAAAKPAEPPKPGPMSPRAMSSDSSVDMDIELEPLPPFHPAWEGDGWNLFLRQPTKKKLASNRFWKPVYVRIMPNAQGSPAVKVFENKDSKNIIQSLDLQSCYTLCNMGLQQYDQYGKCHTIKIQYVFYRERVGVKAERIAPTLGDLVRVRDFSFKGFKDLVHRPKATMILDKSPQASELLKFGSLVYGDFKTFVRQLEDGLFSMQCGRASAVHQYTKDEITCDIIDEYYGEIDRDGHITYHKARVRVFCLAFLTGMPWVELGINDKKRQGREVVGRKDIIPIKTDEWIRTEDVELHHSVQVPEWETEKVLRFRPLDACHYEIMRFRCRPKINKELPLQIRVQWIQSGRKVEIRSDIVIPGYYTNSRRASQTPCEDIQIRIPIPEPWIYLFRVEKRFKYGSLHSTRRKPGKIKGLERITQVAQSMLPPSLIEVSSGSAKYEHIFGAIVWRIGRLPERNEGAYKTHIFQCKLELGPHDAIPEDYEKHVLVEYNMPNSTVSRAQIRSISVENKSDPDYEADKWVHHLAKYEYKVEMEFIDPDKPIIPPSAMSPESPEPESPHTPPAVPEDSSSDSSSSDEE